MPLRVSGKNLDIGDALRSQVETRVKAVLAKYCDGGYSGHVTFARDGTGFRADCVLHLRGGTTIEASGSAFDAYASLDRSVEHAEAQLRRHKKRRTDRAAVDAASMPDGPPAPNRGPER